MTSRTAWAPRSRAGAAPIKNSEANVVREPAGVGTLTRTKSLVHAAVRVWELKQRISH